MSRQFLDHDPLTGRTLVWHELDDGTFGVETVQEIDPVLDHNAALRTSGVNNYIPAIDARLVANIPIGVITKWRNDYGIDYYQSFRDPDVERAIDRLLNDKDWYKLRTDESVL